MRYGTQLVMALQKANQKKAKPLSKVSFLLVVFTPRSLNIRHTDVLTIFDGQDLMSHVIGQYMTSRERFQIVSGGSEVTIQFQSDPVDSSFILSQGFLIHYHGERSTLTTVVMFTSEEIWVQEESVK